MSKGTSMAEFADVVLPFSFRYGKILLLRLHLDDSGTDGRSPVLAVGGLLGTHEQWLSFERDWIALLAAPLPGKPPLKAFSAGDCRWRRPDTEFEDYSIAESDAVTHDFREVIARSKLVAMASAIDKDAWEAAVPLSMRAYLGSPEQRCLIHCVNLAINYARNNDERHIAVVYDQGRPDVEFNDVAKAFKKEMDKRPEVCSVTFSFLPVKECVGLQGADMVATESSWFAQEWLRDGEAAAVRPHFQRFIELVKGAGYLMGRAEIQKEIAQRNPDGSIRR